MADLDQLIEKLESDLASLRRARELARQYESPSPLNGKAKHGVADAPPQLPGGEAWYTFLPELLRDKAMSIREIEHALAAKGTRVAYSTVHSWMKRSVARGEFKRKSAKYRSVEAKDQSAA